MLTTRVFQNGNSQAIRIPNELKTTAKEYCISKIGDIFIAYPVNDPWASARQVIGTFAKDIEREQPSWSAVDMREDF